MKNFQQKNVFDKYQQWICSFVPQNDKIELIIFIFVIWVILFVKTIKVLENWELNNSVIFGDSDVVDITMLGTSGFWLIRDVGGIMVMLTTFFVMLVIFSMY